MSENFAAKRLRDLIPAIMQRWDDRVRAEVSPAAGAPQIVLRDSLAQMLEVMAKVLAEQTDPRTAARDLAYLTIHGKERANQTTYSLEELILEFHILQEVVLEALEPDHLLDTRDRGVIIQYVNEMVRRAAQAVASVDHAAVKGPTARRRSPPASSRMSDIQTAYGISTRYGCQTIGSGQFGLLERFRVRRVGQVVARADRRNDLLDRVTVLLLLVLSLHTRGALSDVETARESVRGSSGGANSPN
jgi:hypothetical protein